MKQSSRPQRLVSVLATVGVGLLVAVACNVGSQLSLLNRHLANTQAQEDADLLTTPHDRENPRRLRIAEMVEVDGDASSSLSVFGNKKRSWASILTADSYNHTQHLASQIRAIKKHSRCKTHTTLVLPAVSEDIVKYLEDHGSNVLQVDRIESPFLIQPWWEDVFAKLHLFNLTQYDQVAYLDADVIISPSAGEADSVFDACFADICGVQDMSEFRLGGSVHGPEASYPMINAGVMVVHPSTDRFETLLTRALPNATPNQLPEQGFISESFVLHRFGNDIGTLQWLDWKYNSCSFGWFRAMGMCYEAHGSNEEERRSCLDHVNDRLALYHYCGARKPDTLPLCEWDKRKTTEPAEFCENRQVTAYQENLAEANPCVVSRDEESCEKVKVERNSGSCRWCEEPFDLDRAGRCIPSSFACDILGRDAATAEARRLFEKSEDIGRYDGYGEYMTGSKGGPTPVQPPTPDRPGDSEEEVEDNTGIERDQPLAFMEAAWVGREAQLDRLRALLHSKEMEKVQANLEESVACDRESAGQAFLAEPDIAASSWPRAATEIGGIAADSIVVEKNCPIESVTIAVAIVDSTAADDLVISLAHDGVNAPIFNATLLSGCSPWDASAMDIVFSDDPFVWYPGRAFLANGNATLRSLVNTRLTIDKEQVQMCSTVSGTADCPMTGQIVPPSESLDGAFAGSFSRGEWKLTVTSSKSTAVRLTSWELRIGCKLTNEPTSTPSARPSQVPSAKPSSVPTSEHSQAPSSVPTSRPSASLQPSWVPTPEHSEESNGFPTPHPSTFACTLRAEASCGDGKTSFCYKKEKKGNKIEYNQECKDDDDIVGLGPGDEYKRNKPIVACGCCTDDPEISKQIADDEDVDLKIGKSAKEICKQVII